jgi:P-type Ca2+ transporter type 2C
LEDFKSIYSKGLTTEQVCKLQRQYGKNEIRNDRNNTFLKLILHGICEPIFLLLLFASLIYFLLGEEMEGIIMLVFVFGIIAMDVLQEWKTDKTMKALKDLSMPNVKVVRDGLELVMSTIELVPGDIMLIEEGNRVPADGFILYSHDFCLDESMLTGEADVVWKDKVLFDVIETKDTLVGTMEYYMKNYCYAGTMVISGNAIIQVDKIGEETVYGKIGVGIQNAKDLPTPLQIQMKQLTITCTWIAVFLFLLVSVITYLNLSTYDLIDRLIESLLSGIVLSLSMIPAEFPVILTVFLSMGALRLTKKHALIRRLPAVETLGAVSVICIDKTGTITENQMTVEDTFTFQCNELELLEIAGLACDVAPYDPMEKAILKYCSQLGLEADQIFQGNFIKGYPFSHTSKTMAHVWGIGDKINIAAKGSLEWLIENCDLEQSMKSDIKEQALLMSKKGLRVLAVGLMEVANINEIPDNLDECQFVFFGLIGLLDPPKESIPSDLKRCADAGIRVIMVTGDNGDTAASIANKVGFPGDGTIINGQQVANMNDEELKSVVRNVNIFSRVVPEQKLRIVNALKSSGEVVAMTGDGVNDAQALKSADIGIAMGLRGSEVAREAADIILLDDNFSTIIETIKDGRRIYNNIKKAIGYVFTIHIPIAFICLAGPLLHIIPSKLMLLPLHVVLLELIMNPTCSTVLERQPADSNIMNCRPRKPKESLLDKKIMLKSTIQGISIFISSFFIYYIYLNVFGLNASLSRTMGLSVLVISNILLILVNCSEKEYAYQSFNLLIRDRGILFALLATIILLISIIYSPISKILMLEALDITELFLSIGLSFIFIFWYEIVKYIKNYRFPLG